MKRLLAVLLLVLIAVSVIPCVCAFDNVNPLETGSYVDRFTDTALVVSTTAISLVEWPSGVVIWTASTGPFFVHYVNYVIPAHYANVGPEDAPVMRYFPAKTLNYFEFTTPANSSIHAHFPNADSKGIALRFQPVTRNGRVWIDLYYDKKLLDDLGGGYLTVLYKTYVKQ